MSLAWMPPSMRRGVSGFFILLFVFASACAQRDHLQPVQSNVWLVSERRELAIGAEVAKEVEREYGVYQDAELTAYIDQIGQTLAKNSDRPNIPYYFKVLDSPIANAFATPGGYIYITRGLMGVFDDEATLAGVLGHEVGHVAARHSAKQIQNTTFASIGLIAASLLMGDKVNDDLLTGINVAATLIFLGYSRGDEDQADILGAKYLHRSGYDMDGMARAMEGLMELEQRNPMQAEQFFRSHPLGRNRVTHIRSWIPRIPNEDVWGGTPPGTAVRGQETYQRIAAPHAIYPGGNEMQATMENLRIGLVRGQRELIVKSIDDGYKDAQNRSKDDYLAYLDGIIANASRITYRFQKIETEPRRTGGAAKCEYVLEVTDKNTRAVRKETGRIYFEFVRPETNLWKISSVRTVAS
jgi:Zn-dependent protease with chaperone function